MILLLWRLLLFGSESEQALHRKCFIFPGTYCGGGAQHSFWTPQNFFKLKKKKNTYIGLNLVVIKI